VASEIETILGSAAAARNCAFELISSLDFNKVVKYMYSKMNDF
jgi:hypothetical protein